MLNQSPGPAFASASKIPSKRLYLLASCLAVVLPAGVAGVVYWLTAAAGLSWRHGGEDGGDLANAIVLDGLPHPTGYGLYLLTGRLATALLANDPARALNLASGVCGALTAGLLGLATFKFNGRFLASAWPNASNLTGVALAGGWLAGLSFAFAPLAWSQALIIEVYSFNSLLLAWLLFALTDWWQALEQSPVKVGLVWLVAGLALSHHRTALITLAVVGLFMALAWRPTGGKFSLKSLGGAAGALMLAVVGGVLEVWRRGSRNPAANWLNVTPDNLLGTWQYLSGEDYRNLLFAAPPGQSLSRIGASFSLLLQQFGLAGLVLGWTGLVLVWLVSSVRPFAWLVSLGMLGHVGFAAVYAAENSQVYLLPAFALWAVMLGGGLAWLGGWLAGKHRAGVWLALAFALAWPALSLAANYGRLDLSAERGAELWAAQQLKAAPPGAILVSEQDASTFALWYANYSQKIRPDLVIIEARLLRREWYRQNLTKLYPTLQLPPPLAQRPVEELLAAANPTRPVVGVSPPPDIVRGLP